MKDFIVYNSKGKILRTGFCQNDTFLLQAGIDESVIEGKANDVNQKIINGKVVDKTPKEIKADKPKPSHGQSYEITENMRPANITNKQWQNVLNRLDKLEKS